MSNNEITDFFQVDADIGSSTVANGVLGLVFGVVSALVVDMAFLIQVFLFNDGRTFGTD